MAEKTPRNITPAAASAVNAVVPVLAAFVIGGIVIALAGKNPLETYWILFRRSLFSFQGLMKTLHYASPLLLTGFAIAVTFKAGIFNMGVESQLLVGGFAAAICGTAFSFLSPPLLIVLCLTAGVVCGMAAAILPALLRAFCNVNELVVTLLLNYAVFIFLEYLTSGPFRDDGAAHVSTHMVPDGAIFSRFGSSRITLFSILVVAVFGVMYILFNRSKLGYEIEAIGKNPNFAEAAGMNVRRKIIVIMTISGALSGFAGAGWLLSEKYVYTLTFSDGVGLGWDGMLIALLGANNPAGILVSAIFYATLKVGVQYVSVFTEVPSEIVALIQAMIVLFLSLKVIRNRQSPIYRKLDRLLCRSGFRNPS